MATSHLRAVESSRSLETQLSNLLANNNVSHARVAELLEQIRAACQTAVVQDIENATAQHVEDRLWNAHHNVRSYFHKGLAQLKSGGNQKTVERRKLGGDYLKFIKSSQIFYRSLIKELALAHGGIEELERVAQRLNKDGELWSWCTSALEAEPDTVADKRETPTRDSVTLTVRELVLQSCHRTLIQLGDLSRYRETDLAEKKPDWGPAMGFYDLAGVIYPASGASHNQLAVMALADGNLFRATYHLYRALSTSQPYPQAEGNLRKAFYKVASAWSAGQLIHSVSSQTSSDGYNHAIVAWYLRMIEKSYRGKIFPERDELEMEIMTQLSNELKRKSLNSMLQKIVLTNMAAGNLAQELFQRKAESGDTSEAMQSYLYMLHLNVRTFTTLLELLTQDSSIKVENEDSQATKQNITTVADKVSILMQRILPALRLYSIWLVKNSAVVSTPVDESSEQLHQKFWRVYAKALTLIANVFPAEQLEGLPYMLEEEADTLGFKPLRCDETAEVWQIGSKVKDRREEILAEPDSAAEMVARVRSILLTGLKLAMAGSTPLTFDETNFQFLSNMEEDPHMRSLDEPPRSVGILQPKLLQENEQPIASKGQNGSQSIPVVVSPTAAADDHQEAEMSSMVDDLVRDTRLPPQYTSNIGETIPTHESPNSQPKSSFSSEANGTGISSFPVGTHTAMDLMAAVKNYSQNQTRYTSPGANGTYGGSGASSRSRPQSQAQSPAPNAPSPSTLAPGLVKPPSRPGTGNNSGSGSFTTPPTAMQMPTHSRIQSIDSFRLNDASPWPASTPPLGQGQGQAQTHQRHASLDPWASYPAPPLPALNTSTASTDYDSGSGMSSSLLFGAGNSPWNMAGDERRRLSIGGGGSAAQTPLSAGGPRTVPATQYKGAMGLWSQTSGAAVSKPPTT